MLKRCGNKLYQNEGFILLFVTIKKNLLTLILTKMSINTLSHPKTKKEISDSGIETMQETMKKTNEPVGQTSLKSLDIQNYVDIRSKSTNQFLSYLNLVQKAFNFDVEAFKREIEIQGQEFQYETLLKIQKNQGIQSLMSFNKDKEFLKSFTGYTRKSNNIVFLLIDRSGSVFSPESQSIHENLKCLFLNSEGRLLHVFSNLQSSSIDKINRVILKHFTVLELLVVVDKISDLQQERKLLSILNQLQKKIIYVNSIGRTASVEPKLAYFQNQTGLKTNSFVSRSFGNSNREITVTSNEELSMESMQPRIMTALKLQEIHQFILHNCLKRQLYPSEMLFKNQFINSIIGLYFNIITSTKTKNLLSINPMEAKLQLDSKIAKLFFSSINRFNSLTNNKKQIKNQQKSLCFPHLFQSSKKCIVCKESKPKFGCLKCTAKFKKQIHLCVNNCFKTFHLDTLKYVSNNFILQNSENLQQISTNRDLKTKKDHELLMQQEKISSAHPECHSHQSSELQSRIYLMKQKWIKKRVKQLTVKYNTPSSKVKGVKVYSFLSPQEDNIYTKNHSYFGIQNTWYQKMKEESNMMDQWSNSTESQKK